MLIIYKESVQTLNIILVFRINVFHYSDTL